MRHKKIGYVGAFRFPQGDAGAARVLAIGKALRQTGREVVFAGGEARDPSKPEFTFQGFSFHSTSELARRQAFSYPATGLKTASWIRTELPDLIICYGGTALFTYRVKRVCARLQIPLVLDLVEWYDYSHLPGGPRGLAARDHEFAMTKQNPSVGHIIAISTFLRDFYSERGCHTVWVPPLIDLEEPKWQNCAPVPLRSDRLELIYAGTPGRKDLLANVLRAIPLMGALSQKVGLTIVGPSKEAVASLLERDSVILETYASSISVVGRVKQSEVPHFLSQAHFGIIIRPEARYTSAGFATKMVEYMAAGAGVISSPVGDTEFLVRNGVDGVIVAGQTPREIATALIRLIEGGPSLWQTIRSNSYTRVRSLLDFHNYVDPISEFIDAIPSNL